MLACQATIGTFEFRAFFWPHYLVLNIMFCFYYNNNWHSNADGKEACLWCTRPGFDPRRVHFVISLTIPGQSNALYYPALSIHSQHLTTGCPTSQIQRVNNERPPYSSSQRPYQIQRWPGLMLIWAKKIRFAPPSMLFNTDPSLHFFNFFLFF